MREALFILAIIFVLFGLTAACYAASALLYWLFFRTYNRAALRGVLPGDLTS